MAEIVLAGVTKRYPDGTTAVDRFDLTIADGEFIILVGPSGCGKSTTLNMIAGLEDITEGELRIDGAAVNDKAPRDRDIAMVFQSYALYPHMSVRENIAFPLRLAKVDKAAAAAKVEEAARMLDLHELLDRKPAALSGGQRQRVAMGRAIVRDPKAFLMDEPLSNLDAKLRVQMRTTISRLQKRLGTTTVYVTHDQTEAMTLGDRIVLMRRGLVQQVGSPEELYHHPRNLFVAGFIGSPSMNFLPAEVDGDALTTVIGTVPLTERMRRGLAEHGSPRRVILGIRPEALEDASLGGQGGATALGGAAEVTFTGRVDILEDLGAEKYAYINLGEAGAIASEHLAEAFQGNETEDGQVQLVARIAADSPAREGRDVTLAYDPEAVHIFEPDSGANLTEAVAAGVA
ncbi:ABC transporter ATP-binding protein [Actinomadura parmotrematis]|uniref:Sn-glycerol-3-phosphate ABC transporter ATP-binding protein UgpC n=1 Tax=Actinomadura parmotrematis TaxID=2864039 RepID=A0ABS7FSJ3_9ACTN|nr:sn-glycerol-3-phosphate ABC transporter ATP-binding protein UgpC [Actinomadura parmotrematis]MBW8483316.1 sn-glycerol-3-phosphate ABC transporter ATP-binding protein UgpC [Actinomadura parmotrematis]